MNLVMFDMDGTLTDSFSFDENCYVLAIQQALGLPRVVPDWEGYAHASSSYCLDAIVRAHHGRPVTAAESEAVQRRMVALMAEIGAEKARHTAEIPGAADCVRALLDQGHAVAIASGSSARDTALASRTLAHPSSIASAASDAVPIPASQITGTPARSTMIARL